MNDGTRPSRAESRRTKGAREIEMARGRGDRAAKASTPAVVKGTPTVRAVPPRAKKGQKGQNPTVRGTTRRSSKPELEQFDLKAALPFFLARLGIFLVIAAVLFFAVGLNILFAVLFGLVGGAAAGYPLARMQKRAARQDEAAAPPTKPIK
jgi:hypothetical protein